MKILFLVFMSEIKIGLTLKKSNFLFLLCFQIEIIKFFSNGPAITTEKQLFSSPEHEVLMVSYCDQSMSVVRRQQFVLKANSS